MPSLISSATKCHARFEEDVALHERMAAIGQTVRDRGYPDVLLFQVCLTCPSFLGSCPDGKEADGHELHVRPDLAVLPCQEMRPWASSQKLPGFLSRKLAALRDSAQQLSLSFACWGLFSNANQFGSGQQTPISRD